MRRIGFEKLNLLNCAPPGKALIHEPDQGFFHCWLLEVMRKEYPDKMPPFLVLSGRNILALEAASHNTKYCNAETTNAESRITLVSAADLELACENLLKAADSFGTSRQYDFIAAFPEFIPQSLLPKKIDPVSAFWKSLPALLVPGGVFIAGFSSVNAERFDRVKLSGFRRLGDIKRKGFRALGYVFEPR